MVSNDRFRKVLLAISVLIFLVVVFYFLMNAITKYTGFFISEDINFDNVEDCLREENIKFYINSEDVETSLKDSEVFEVLDSVEIINCLRDNERCLNEGIDEFPVWIINGDKIKRDVSYLELLEYSKC
jgi:hypothetical protein